MSAPCRNRDAWTPQTLALQGFLRRQYNTDGERWQCPASVSAPLLPLKPATGIMAHAGLPSIHRLNGCCYTLEQICEPHGSLTITVSCPPRTAPQNCSLSARCLTRNLSAPCANSRSCWTAQGWASFSCDSGYWCAATNVTPRFLAMRHRSRSLGSAAKSSTRAVRNFANWGAALIPPWHGARPTAWSARCAAATENCSGAT